MIKTGHQPTLRPDGAIWVGPAIYGLASELVDDSGLVWPLCGLLDGSRTTAEITATMEREHQASVGQVREILDLMLSHGWLVDAAAELPPELPVTDVIRHKRTLEFLCDIDESPRPSPYTLLTKLRRSSVTILGAGGVGSADAASLAATDVGSVTGAIADADLAFSCADRPYEVHDWVNSACFAARKPWMNASYTQSMVATATPSRARPAATPAFPPRCAPRSARSASRRRRSATETFTRSSRRRPR
jgi:hypothetical protein